MTAVPKIRAEGTVLPIPPLPRRMPRLGLLPELAPEERGGHGLQTMGARIQTAFKSDLVQYESTDFTERAETRDPIAQLTVYAMNATVLVLAFPVGFGLLIFNILGGENLRTTAHVLSLTGTGVGVGML